MKLNCMLLFIILLHLFKNVSGTLYYEYRKNDLNKNKVLVKDKTTLFDQVKDKEELNIIINNNITTDNEI